ncbi:copper amine oxidase [Blattamonas nauphoetae]|uniref:Copper amine oxidase n=1 Tax=Blattamonas nauphoetae TaxID=2049346 RepID=A0ABQ9Y5P6_9EUKA|nr:copper amine oxidase [Blattamonas nauphoetae]
MNFLVILPLFVFRIYNFLENVRFNRPTHATLLPDGSLMITDKTSSILITSGSTAIFANRQVSPFLLNPHSTCLSLDSSTLYISDTGHHRIRALELNSLELSLVSGSGRKGHIDGSVHIAQFNSPQGMCLSTDGSLLVADTGNHCIRSISTDGKVSTLAGKVQRDSVSRNLPKSGTKTAPKTECQSGFEDGPLLECRFRSPTSIVQNEDGLIFIADKGNHCIRMVYEGTVMTLAGVPQTRGYSDGTTYFEHTCEESKLQQDGYQIDESSSSILNSPQQYRQSDNESNPAKLALFDSPSFITLSNEGELIVCDEGNHAIRVISADLKRVDTLVGCIPENCDSFHDTTPSDNIEHVEEATFLANEYQPYKATNEQKHEKKQLPQIFSSKGMPGFVDGTALGGARLRQPKSVCLFGEGMIVVDSGNHALRVIISQEVLAAREKAEQEALERQHVAELQETKEGTEEKEELEESLSSLDDVPFASSQFLKRSPGRRKTALKRRKARDNNDVGEMTPEEKKVMEWLREEERKYRRGERGHLESNQVQQEAPITSNPTSLDPTSSISKSQTNSPPTQLKTNVKSSPHSYSSHSNQNSRNRGSQNLKSSRHNQPTHRTLSRSRSENSTSRGQKQLPGQISSRGRSPSRQKAQTSHDPTGEEELLKSVPYSSYFDKFCWQQRMKAKKRRETPQYSPDGRRDPPLENSPNLTDQKDRTLSGDSSPSRKGQIRSESRFESDNLRNSVQLTDTHSPLPFVRNSRMKEENGEENYDHIADKEERDEEWRTMSMKKRHGQGEVREQVEFFQMHSPYRQYLREDDEKRLKREPQKKRGE